MEPAEGSGSAATTGGSGSAENTLIEPGRPVEDDIDTLFAQLSQELTAQEEVSSYN